MSDRWKDRFVYGAAKAAAIGLTKSLAADFIAQEHPRQCDLPRHDRKSIAAGSYARAGRL
jgi:hypothetical protein